MTEYKELMERALGDDATADFYFEVACAEAFCSIYSAPFYVHVGYNILYYAAEHFRTHGSPPGFPTERPCNPDSLLLRSVLTTSSIDESLAKASTFTEERSIDEGAAGRDWIPERTTAEQDVEACEHANLGTTKDLGLRMGLCHLDVLGFLQGTFAPVCKHCKAKILCACIAEDVQRHLGATHAVLANYVFKRYTKREGEIRISGTRRCLTRCGRGCIGFKPGLCDLCRYDRPPVPEDTRFRTIYSFMHAIRFCLEDEPGIYHALFDGSQEREEEAKQSALASAFVEILRGELTRELRITLHREPPDVPPIEAFRPYLNRARNMFRAAYGLPGINEGWVSETQLLQIVKRLFPEEQVLDHYHPHWLRGLELDIYLPNRSLAFEYMGIQHYQPVDRFGGVAAFSAVVERDRIKRELCARRGVRLIDVRYDESLTMDVIQSKINDD